MRVLIAGGSGVLGRALIPLLLEAGHDVNATTRTIGKTEQIALLGARPAVLDALDPVATVSVVEAAAPDVVIDLLTDLAHGSSASNARLRTEATSHLVAAARAVGVQRLVAESIAWAYRPGTESAVERDPIDLGAAEPRRTTIRGIDALETAVRTFPNSVILRFGLLYGPGTWYSPDGRYGDDARAGTLPSTEAVTSFIHIDDAAAAIRDCLQWPSGTYNIVDDEPAPGTEWVPAFAAAAGAAAPMATATHNIGRPVDNSYARARGLQLTHLSWRSGFTAT